MIGTSKSAQEAANAIKNDEMSAKAYTTQAQASAVATKGLGTSSKIAAVGVKALNIAMNAGIMLAVSWAISAVVKGIDNLVHANERAIESAQELSAKYEETSKSISGNIETVQGLKSEFETLSKGVSDNGKNVALSADEYKHYQEIIKQITDISPTLIKGYDDEGNAIADKNDLIEKSIELLKEQQRIELLKQTTPENNQKMAKSAISQYETQVDQVKQQQKEVADQIVSALSQSGEGVTKEVFEKFSSAFNLDTALAKNGSEDPTTWLKWILTDADNLDKVTKTLGSNFEKITQFADGASLTNIANAMTLLGDATDKSEIAAKDFQSTLSLNAKSIDGYSDLSDGAQQAIQAYISTLKLGTDATDADTKAMIDNVKLFTATIVESPQQIDAAMSSLPKILSDKATMPFDKWIQERDKFINEVGKGLNDEQKNNLKVSFGLDIDFDTDALYDEIDKALGDNSDLAAKIKSLPIGELQFVYQYGIENLKGMSIDEFLSKLKELKAEAAIQEVGAKLSSSFSDLSSQLDSVNSHYKNYALITDSVNKKTIITDNQYQKLITDLPEVKDKLTKVTGGWQAESGAIDIVGTAVSGLSSSYSLAQAAMNDAIQNGVGYRLKQLGYEITGIQSIINAYNALNGQKATAAKNLYDKVGKGTGGDAFLNNPNKVNVDVKDANGNSVSKEQLDQVTKETSELISAQNALNTAQSQLNSLNSSVGKTPSSGSSGSSSSAKDTTDTWKEAFDKYYAEIQYLRETDQISDEEYYNRLLALNNKYFKGKSKYLSEFRQYDEELYNLEKSISADRINDMEHEIFLLSKKSDTEQQQIDVYKKMQDEVHAIAEAARARGIDENDEYLQSLQKQWYSYQDDISSINQSLYDNAISDYQDYIEEKERYGWGSEKESDVIKKEIALTEKYYKQGLINFEYYSEKIKSLNDELYDALKSQTQSYYEGVRDYAVSQIDEEIQALQDELDANNEYYENKIQNLQDQQDETSKVREEEEKLLAIEKARIALAKAESSKTVQTYVNGVGFTWMADETAVTEAQDSLNDALKEYNQYKEDLAIDNLIEDLEDAKDANEKSINAQIDNLEDLKDAWSDSLDISDDVEKYQEYLEEILGDENSSYSERLADVKQFVSDYNEEIDKLQTKSSSSSSGSSSGSTTTAKVTTGATVGAAVGGVTGSIIGTAIGSVVSTITKAITGKYASGTTSAAGGLSLVGEEGAEFRVLNKGDGIIPADFTQNLMSWGNFTPSSFAESLKSMFSTPSLSLVQAAPVSNSVSFGGDIVVEYSGNDAEGFAKALKSKLPNAVLQQLYKR